MDILHFSSSPTFSPSSGTVGGDGNAADLDISIEELALSMQHHLLRNDDSGTQNSILTQNNYANTNQNTNFNRDFSSSNGSLDWERVSRSPSPHKLENSRIKTPPSRYSHGSSIANGHYSLPREKPPAYPRLESKFYKELQQKYPKAFQKRRSSQESVNTDRSFERNDHSPAKVLVKTEEKENNSPKARTRLSLGGRRSSLEAARSYISLSRQSLNASSDENKGYGSESESSKQLKSRLRRNSMQMEEVLQKTEVSKYRSQENLNSIKNIAKDYTDGRRFSSMDNLALSARRGDLGYVESQHDSAVEMGDGMSHDSRIHPNNQSLPGYSLRRYSSGPVYNNGPSSTSDTEYGNSHRGYHTADSDGDSGIGRYDMKYRHAASEMDLHRNQRSGQTSIPNSSKKEALRLLQKKRESGGLPNGHIPARQNGPLKADHNIQPIKQDRSSNYDTPPDPYRLQGARPKHASSSAIIPPEYDIVAQELLQDTPIRSHHTNNHDNSNHGNYGKQERHHRSEDRQRSSQGQRSSEGQRSRSDRNADSQGLTRSPSKCSERSIRSNGSSRSVRFEDENKHQNRQRHSRVEDSYDDPPDESFYHPEPPPRTSKTRSKSNQKQSRTSYENPYSDIELEYQERTRKKTPTRKTSLEHYESANGDLRHSFSDVDYEERSHSRASRQTVTENPYEELPPRSKSRSGQRRDKQQSSPQSDMGYANPHMDRMLSMESPYAEVEMRSNSRTPRSSRDGSTHSPEHHPSVKRKPPSGKPSGRPRSMPEMPSQYSPPSPSSSTYARSPRSGRHRPNQPPPPPPPHSARSASHDTDSLCSNPCIVNDYDDSISEIDESPKMMTRGYVSDLERYSEMSGSRTSLASRTSVSDKIQSFGKAAKKKFGSLRRAISLDRLDKSNHADFYERPKMKKSPSLRSLSSLLGRKKESDYDTFYQQERLKQERKMQRPNSARSERSVSSRMSSSSVTSPNYLRKVGRILKSHVDGTQVIELVRPPSGPFGFYIARGNEKFGRGIFVSRMSDGYPEKMYAGLMGVGDEILAINGHSVLTKSMDEVYDLMADQDRLTLKILPLLARKDW